MPGNVAGIDSFQRCPYSKVVKHKDKADYFPFFTNISGKSVCVFGGGKIAMRRVKTLSVFNFDITVIAKEITGELKEFCESLNIKYFERPFIEGKIINCGKIDFVLAATNNKSVNRQIALECKTNNIPVSVCDDKRNSSFFFPAIIKKDDIIIGITSGGINHRELSAVSVKIRDIIQ